MIKRISIGTGGDRQRQADELYDRTVREQGLSRRDESHMHLRVWESRTWGEGDEFGADAPEAVPADAPSGVRPACPAPWKTPVIRWDGQVMACCADTDGAIEVGNVADEGFVALWRGERMNELRLAHLLGQLDAFPYCQACGGFTWYELDRGEVRDWLGEIGRADLWPRVAARFGWA